MNTSSPLRIQPLNLTTWKTLGVTSGAFLAAGAALAQPDYAPAHWSPITGCTKWYTSGNGHHFCVIHDMEGYYYSTISYLKNCNNTVSVYYLANSDYNSSDGAPAGDITQEVRESQYAWHVGCWNLWMFGTEHEGFSANGNLWYTESMYQASALLQRHLCDVYGIPKDRNHVIAHGQKSVAGWCTWLAANYPSINCYCNSHTDPGIYWNWSHFMDLINGAVNNASVVSSSVPTSVTTGQVFTATITMNNNGTVAWTNTGANAYKLGSQNPQDNTTWGLSRVALPSSPINPGANATFTISARAPMSGGSYAFGWKMLQEGVQWFGDTFNSTISVTVPGTVLAGDWWGNSDITPTAFGGGWATSGDCGTYWYIYSHFTSCAARGFNMTFNPGFAWNGRGFIHCDWVNGGAKADTVLTMRWRKQDGTLSGVTTGWDDCAHTCSWQSVLDQETGDVFNWNGLYRNADEDTAGACGSVCGIAPSAGREIHMYGDKWVYLNDWVTFGGFTSAAGVSDVNWTPPFAESGLYVYGAVDTTHGNYFANNLYGGHTPYRVQTGDCGAASLANFLNFKGNAGANGNNNCDNCNAYAFAWVETPSGAGPQWGVGSDDGDRIWLNGTMIADNNTARGQTWDQDRFAPTGMAAGWNRVLFKVHNGGGGFSGVVSLHNGSDFHRVEPSVYIQTDRYNGFSAGYEQDGWYPQIAVASFYGQAGPINGAAYYGNSTTVAASGTSNGQGPVPLWRTMQYQWGYGLGNADSNYADVSGTPTAASWSHSTAGVTGHRRFHFFAVSKSGRTSFQNSGASGGSRFQDSGNFARYYDLYVDNVAPQNPAFSSVSAVSPTEIDLAWPIPLDQGVNVGPGSAESAGGSGNADSQNWYRVGDVAVEVDRDGGPISSTGEGGTFVTDTALSDTGLTPNTPHTYTIEAHDNNTGTRGVWNNTTGPKGTNTTWTLSVPPGLASITPDNATPTYGSAVTWTAVNGFGAGQVQYYRYSFDTSPTHTFTDTETQWSSGTVAATPTSAATWYLHVKGYNGANVGNGTFNYSVTVGQKALTVTGIGASDKPYDGNATAALTGTPGTLNGVVGTDSVALGGTAAGAFANQNVGTNKIVSVSGQTLTGGSATNYTLTEPVTTANITRKGLTVTGIAADDKVYDTTTSATIHTGGATLVGKISGDDVNLNTGSASGVFADANVGSGKTVSISGLTISGGDAGNYSLSQPTASASITPASSASALVSSQNPSTPGSNVTFTATVSAVAPGAGTPSGDVVFAANGTPFSTNALVSGAASASTASLPSGTNTVAAQYAGDANFLTSSDTLQQIVQAIGACSQTNAIVGIAPNGDGTFTITFVGTVQAQYYVVSRATLQSLPGVWDAVTGSTNTVTNNSGLWYYTITNTEPQRFYRSVAISPCP